MNKLAKFLVVMAFMATTAYAQVSSITFTKAVLIASSSTDYASDKPIIVSKEGNYVCPDKFDMYYYQKTTKNLYLVVPKSRLFSTDKEKIIVVCGSVTP